MKKPLAFLAILVGVLMFMGVTAPAGQAAARNTTRTRTAQTAKPSCVSTYKWQSGFDKTHRPYMRAEWLENTCGFVLRVKLEWCNCRRHKILGRNTSRWVAHRQTWRTIKGSVGSGIADDWVQRSRCQFGCTIVSSQKQDADDWTTTRLTAFTSQRAARVLCETAGHHYCATAAPGLGNPVKENLRRFALAAAWEGNGHRFHHHPEGVIRFTGRRNCADADPGQSFSVVKTSRCSGVSGVLWARQCTGSTCTYYNVADSNKRGRLEFLLGLNFRTEQYAVGSNTHLNHRFHFVAR